MKEIEDNKQEDTYESSFNKENSITGTSNNSLNREDFIQDIEKITNSEEEIKTNEALYKILLQNPEYDTTTY